MQMNPIWLYNTFQLGWFNHQLEWRQLWLWHAQKGQMKTQGLCARRVHLHTCCWEAWCQCQYEPPLLSIYYGYGIHELNEDEVVDILESFRFNEFAMDITDEVYSLAKNPRMELPGVLASRGGLEPVWEANYVARRMPPLESEPGWQREQHLFRDLQRSMRCTDANCKTILQNDRNLKQLWQNKMLT